MRMVGVNEMRNARDARIVERLGLKGERELGPALFQPLSHKPPDLMKDERGAVKAEAKIQAPRSDGRSVKAQHVKRVLQDDALTLAEEIGNDINFLEFVTRKNAPELFTRTDVRVREEPPFYVGNSLPAVRVA